MLVSDREKLNGSAINDGDTVKSRGAILKISGTDSGFEVEDILGWTNSARAIKSKKLNDENNPYNGVSEQIDSINAYIPALSEALGVFLPLIVVNCIIMGRVESFASKNTVPASILDALGMGIGYTWVLTAISLIRELLGNGTLLNTRIIPEEYTVGLFSKAPGGFIVFGLMIALTAGISTAVKNKKKNAAKAAQDGAK